MQSQISPSRTTALKRLGALLGVLALLPLASQANPADLDPSFDGDGKQFVDMPARQLSLIGEARAVALQSDGKVVVAGKTYLDSYPSSPAVVRLNADGTLDGTFGSGGKVMTPFLSHGATSVVVQSDGKIVVAATAANPGISNYALAVVRLNPNGSFDTSFDGDGLCLVNVKDFLKHTEQTTGQALALQSDGKIVVACNVGYYGGGALAVVRLNTDGSLDNSFNGEGFTRLAVGTVSSSASDIALQSDGKVVVAGRARNTDEYQHAALARFNADGTVDTSFDGDGSLVFSLGNNVNSVSGANAVALQNNGKIVVAGEGGDFSTDYYASAVARFNSNGSLDTTLGGDGIVVDGTVSMANDMAVQSDGKIVVTGNGRLEVPSGPEDEFGDGFRVTRLNLDGSPDSTFNGDGNVIVPVPVVSAFAAATVLQSDGKIVVAGYASTGNIDAIAVVRVNANGSPDSEFANGPVLQIEFSPSYDSAQDIALQSNGKMVVVGNSSGGFAISRLNSDGSLDNSFNGNGKVTVKIGVYGCLATCVALQGDGKIIVAGYANAKGFDAFAVARLNSDGSLDTSFDGDGKRLILVGDFGSAAQDVAVAKNGKILLVGNGSKRYEGGPVALVRLNSDGSLDTSFDGDGQAFASGGFPRAMALQSDGKVVVAIKDTMSAVRFNANGSLDTSFDGDGKVVVPLGVQSGANAVAIQGDGKILLAGYLYDNSPDVFVVVRLNPDGTLDTGFDSDGKMLISVGSTFAQAYTLAIQKNGQIVVAGVVWNANRFAVVRLNPDGSVDNSFGNEGRLLLSMGESDTVATSVALQSDGKIVVVGYGTATMANSVDFAIARLTGTFVPTISVSNARTLPEGSIAAPGSTTFDIRLNAPSTQSVTVTYQTLNGLNNPAVAGSDYIAKSGKLTFAPGETGKRVTIKFVGDSTPELHETFFLDLKTATNATLADNRGVGTIRNDDGPNLAIANATPVDEGKSTATKQAFVVSLSTASTDAITVDWATAYGTAGVNDFVQAAGTLTFAPGETNKLIMVQINGDTTVEPNETYQVNLSKPTYALISDAHATGLIRNDDAAALILETDEPSQ